MGSEPDCWLRRERLGGFGLAGDRPIQDWRGVGAAAALVFQARSAGAEGAAGDLGWGRRDGFDRFDSFHGFAWFDAFDTFDVFDVFDMVSGFHGAGGGACVRAVEG